MANTIRAWLFPVMWFAYLAYWRAMADDVKADERVESPRSRLTRTLVLLLAVVLLWVPSVPLEVLNRRFLPPEFWWFWVGAGVTAGGLLFSVWARAHLGSNWSQALTVKEGHELITNGPYALVRHPIYTGLLTGFAGCALARGEWRALLAVVLVFEELFRKLRLEERWMRERFGAEYNAYTRRVAALVPFVL